jgi:hypothetical protein
LRPGSGRVAAMAWATADDGVGWPAVADGAGLGGDVVVAVGLLVGVVVAAGDGVRVGEALAGAVAEGVEVAVAEATAVAVRVGVTLAVGVASAGVGLVDGLAWP